MSETRTYNNTICQVYNNQNTILFKWSAINPTSSSIKETYVVIIQFSAALVKCIESVNNLLMCLRSYQKNNINLYHCLISLSYITVYPFVEMFPYFSSHIDSIIITCLTVSYCSLIINYSLYCDVIFVYRQS